MLRPPPFFIRLPALVGVQGGGQVFLPQAHVQKEVEEAIETGADRHAKEHAGNAEKAATHQDSDDDPEAGEAGFVPQDHGADNVSVQLLEHQDENKEIQGLQRRDQQNQEGAGDGPQEGPKKGITLVTPTKTDTRGV